MYPHKNKTNLDLVWVDQKSYNLGYTKTENEKYRK